MLKFNNVLHPDICDGDITFDVIWAKRFQGQDTPCVHNARPGHSMCTSCKAMTFHVYTMNEYTVHHE